MPSNMLIDATHPEETRVVVLRGNKIEEFDYESSARKQIRGNIYLAKVTRVEPSLQAAFVDYGGNRHGFLAFSEIHPDYYQIPVADRQALLREESRGYRGSDDENNGNGNGNGDSENGDAPAAEAGENGSDTNGDGTANGSSSHDISADSVAAGDSTGGNGNSGEDSGENGHRVEEVEWDPDSHKVESVGADDAMEEASDFTRKVKRVYKIQEVIKRRQILLVQVVKEERGNKGAALTTYLSLAGRYCVLMPNTARGGGVSRKITDTADRRRLKELARELEVPEGMGVIVRTAGANRTKVEIKRDYDYLLRQWESIRDLTLQSTAPTLIYEEGSLIKRAIRDLYTKDVDQILVEGARAQREAREFMKMLMPSHVRNVKIYQDSRPLFSRYQVEAQLDSLFSPTVTLSSGGYIVINQTEALVSIDVNSGKSTREHNIEDTALKTNLEAADEIARQLRLRDLAGLIVIDFIDMEEKRNNRAVERRMKEALKNDRARIQVGRISHFGLLEMSRQRLRVGMLEGSTVTCPTCLGRGVVRSNESCALSVLRGIEEHLMRRAEDITIRCDPKVAFYLLNQKRHHVLAIEQTYGVSIYLEPSDDLHNEHIKIERAEGRPVRPVHAAVQVDTAFVQDAMDDEASAVEADEDVLDDEAALEAVSDAETSDYDEDGQVEGRQARNGHNGNGHHEGDEAGRRRRRRRGRRGGRRNRGDGEFGAHDGMNGAATAEDGTVQIAGDDTVGSEEAPLDPGASPQPDTDGVEIPEFQAAINGDRETEESLNRSRHSRRSRRPRRDSTSEAQAPAGDENVGASSEAGHDEADAFAPGQVAAGQSAPSTSAPTSEAGDHSDSASSPQGDMASADGEDAPTASVEPVSTTAAPAEGQKRPRRSRKTKEAAAKSGAASEVSEEASSSEDKDEAAAESGAKPKRRSRASTKAGAAKAGDATIGAEGEPDAAEAKAAAKPRTRRSRAKARTETAVSEVAAVEEASQPSQPGQSVQDAEAGPTATTGSDRDQAVAAEAGEAGSGAAGANPVEADPAESTAKSTWSEDRGDAEHRPEAVSPVPADVTESSREETAPSEARQPDSELEHAASPAPVATPAPERQRPARRGWWQRKLFGE